MCMLFVRTITLVIKLMLSVLLMQWLLLMMSYKF